MHDGIGREVGCDVIPGRAFWLKALGLILVLALFWALLPSSAAAVPPTPPAGDKGELPGSDDLPTAPIDPEILRRIEPALLKRLMEGDEDARFIIHLKEEAEPAAAAAGKVGSLERGRAVVASLQATAERSQGDLRRHLGEQVAAGKVRGYIPFWIFNGVAAEGNLEAVLALAARPEVRVIRADQKRYLESQEAGGEILSGSDVEWNIDKVGADMVWQALGIDGTGAVVASMDTGVDWQHPALMSNYRGYDPHGLTQHTGNWFCATDEGYAYPGDGDGHGTHTMGIIVGRGDPAIGMAPGASWIAAKVFHNLGYTYDSWLHAGFQWMLDPDGNPGTDDAPDVVNNSWGSNLSELEVFRPDLQALTAAGILPVFAAGNYGPASYTIGSPASLPEAFAVGATDEYDYILTLSSRGPSPWAEIKPEVSAPGINVRSSLPGGGYGLKDGTSMAAPHVTGLTALLLQAQPDLTIPEIEQVITGTAVALGDPAPNNDYGWGRIDAYNAVTSVSDAGFLSGTVTDSNNGAPVMGATVSVEPHGGGSTVVASTDSQGGYSLALAPDVYDVTVSAFAYETSIAYNETVTTGQTTLTDFALQPSDVGSLAGRITEEGTGTYLEATVVISGTPATAQSDPATGLYSVALPAGTYDVNVLSPNHRVVRAQDVEIAADEVTHLDFSLSPAPSILLVDGGAWYGESQIAYFTQALDAEDYLYDLWTIHQPFETPSDVPAEDDLLPYDIVIWSCPLDSPGYVSAWEALAAYLDDGGRLFLTGQDIGYWDGGGTSRWSPQYVDYVKARLAADDSGSRDLAGAAGDIFEGMNISVEGGDGADNQVWPDEIVVDDPDHAVGVIQYQNDGSGGQRVGLCVPYRVLYLSFGFEGIDSREDRREVMRRAIEWLTSPRQVAGVELSPPAQTGIGAPAAAVTHTLRVRNTGQVGDTSVFSLTVTGHSWPTALVTDTLTLTPCGSGEVAVRVDVPADESWQAEDTALVTARSVASPTVEATATVTSRTPAPILLVEDDLFNDNEEAYQNALDGNGVFCDLWRVHTESGWTSPPLQILQRYHIVVWFTGYDWFSTLSAGEEASLSSYLDGGGRLFFSSQDYLYTNGLTSFGQDYLGIRDHVEDAGVTVVRGESGSLVGDGLGPYDLTYSYTNWSDALTPTVASEVAFRGDDQMPIGLAHAGQGYRTVYFSFPFETLDAAGGERVMERVIGWLSWLGKSEMSSDPSVAASGCTITYTVSLENDGWEDVTAHLSNTLPSQIDYISGTLVPLAAGYDPGSRRISWDGALPSGETVEIAYQATITGSLPAETTIRLLSDVGFDEHGISFDRWARTGANFADLSPSTLSVDRSTAAPGDSLLYSFTLRNDGSATASSVELVNPVPDHTSYVTGSLSYSDGTAVLVGGVISWTGSISVGMPVTLSYQVTVANSPAGFSIDNRADLHGGYDSPHELKASTYVPHHSLHLPSILKGP
jgi:uncharacterized repeat protein (TIGR01451 family)